MGDNVAAIEMYRGVLAQTPDDAQAIAKLADLYLQRERYPELLALRRHELSLSPPAERRLDIRLELAGIFGEIDKQGGRLQVLRNNLEESPGHEPSIEALCLVLDGRSSHGELLDLLSDQSRKLEDLEDNERAARLWALVADIAESQAEDLNRAIDAHRRVVALSSTQDSLDALARLYVETGHPEEAVTWLERSISGAPPERKTELVLRLANAHLGADNAPKAINALERAIEDGEGDAPAVRRLLVDLYRKTSRWEPLARLLTESLSSLAETSEAIAWATEAAEIYNQKLHTPANALPALEKALSIAPDDRNLRLMMATGLRVAGNHEDARGILEALISEFGRRRSKERAAVHVELAQVARAESKLDEAVQELELASKMDSGNAHILKTLAELSRENGKHDQAERSLRLLLLVVRRQPPGDDEHAVGVSEVLFELHRIAAERDDDDKAKELLESALEAAVQTPNTARPQRARGLAARS
jgi:tetratricopeptide (TPR) repeat protein